MNFSELRDKIICDALDKFPDAGTRTIATYITNKHPEFFESFEQARWLIRYRRGQAGPLHKTNLIKSGRYTKYVKSAGEL